MKTTLLVLLIITQFVQFVSLVAMFRVMFKSWERFETLNAQVRQEMQNTDRAVARLKRASDPNLTQEEIVKLLFDLQIEQAKLKSRMLAPNDNGD